MFINWLFLLLWTFISPGQSLQPTPSSSDAHGSIAFRYQNPRQCRHNEFYDLDYFACAPCGDASDIGKLQPSANKFSCQCASLYTAIYEQGKTWPTCLKVCNKENATEECQPAWQPTKGMPCVFQYLNSTAVAGNLFQAQPSGAILLTQLNVGADNASGDCHSCDPAYNFRYQGFCIASALLRPYLHYNAFWQSTGSLTTSAASPHFGELKFVAFFCLTLRQSSACNQLANLCVLSHFSQDKHSPCSAFLLTQVSDVVMRYANSGEQLRAQQPFLFYKKGKSLARQLGQPLEQPPYRLDGRLQLFSTVYSLSGELKRWGDFRLQHVNLCQLLGADSMAPGLPFAQRQPDVACQLTLEQLIELATLQANDNFISIYLNFTLLGEIQLQPLPVLIETLTPENQRSQREEWQLVKRFQLIEAQPRQRYQSASAALYEDAHKLSLYRSLRYVEHLELHYDIHAGNRIGVPLIKLRYRHIELAGNSSLRELHSFGLAVRFQRLKEGNRRQLLQELALPLLLILALVAALLRAYNIRRRRPTSSESQLCDIACFLELLLQLAGNVALALLGTALLLLLFNSLEFLWQRSVEITLPLLKPGQEEQRALTTLVYLSCLLQLGYLGVQLRRASQLELFFIDWERPRSCEQQHFNMKSNLETSSVCSSVRTYVAESNVSAWRALFTANAWIRLSIAQKYSSVLQALLVILAYELLDRPSLTHEDLCLRCCLLAFSCFSAYLLQLLLRQLIVDRIWGSPLQQFVDLCSLANISLFSLLEPGFGYYIHGRSPHGFADTDMSSMIMQLQREAQSMCGRRGLLMDSDKQAYIILPPRNLRVYLDRLLLPYQRSFSISQTFYQKDIPTIDGQVERTSIAYASVNRFFCAYIDHAIKDLDYIIKEKTFTEKLLNCEIDNYLTENKGTFYIDDGFGFARVLLLGNHGHIFVLEILLLLSTFLLTASLWLSVAVACGFNMLLRNVFHYWVRRNVSSKTLIDKRFLL